ncbi:hypothetical protein BB934_45280 (plasmid) [Microvirga ossetica]|uniref:Uncharacterized protein n=1 Tax=Microvirga ossetica TaxID=1882682 RepID=A0A1B2EZR0_9HYPH|nr:hypothetical protein [Microvirga ossetica]ANY85434.1 hypothetical protein BB934_45280 [Microvirga ossetica]
MTFSPNSLTNNMWGWRFGFQLDELRRSYEAAREASDRDRIRIERQWSEFEAEVAAGRASFIEEDEEGRLISDHGDHVGEMLSEINGVLHVLREAFTISLHHFWERQLKSRMKVKEYKEAMAFAFLKDQGITPNEPMLTALRLTANVAKHSEGNSADHLFILHPDLFDVTEMTKWDAEPSHEYLKITDELLNHFFSAVRDSGPTGKAIWS